MIGQTCNRTVGARGLDRLRLCLLLSGATALLGFAGAVHAQDIAAPAELDDGDIVVTATKRSERLQDVPIAITAIGNEELVRAHVSGTADLARMVPSLAIKTLVPGENQIVMRGINTGYGLAPAVSYYLDETPFDLRSDGFSGAPDIDFFDVARVEALRGPQGTLYGASSMGGTIRIITNAPSTKGFDYKAEVTGSLPKGGTVGYEAKAVVNIPLTDNLAGRIFASHIHSGGFVDRIVPVNGYFATTPSDPVGQKNDNRADLTSVRAALRWTPDDWVITPTISFQNNIAKGYPYSDANRPHYQYNNLFRSRNKVRNTVANLKIEKPLGSLQLVSSTSYLDKVAHNLQDYSGTGQRYWRGLGLNPDEVVPMTSRLPKTYKSWVQELRLSSDGTGAFNWVAGLFYDHVSTNEQQYISSAKYVQAAAPGYPTDVEFYDIIPWTDEQYAAFVDGTLKLGPVKLSAGGRFYHYKQVYSYYEGGLDGAPDVNNVTGIMTSKSGFNPRLNVEFKPDRDISLYATASKGFRVGGVNPSLVASAGSTCSFQSVFQRGYSPDSLWNYEIGAKTQTRDHRLTFNVDGYRIDWNNIQQGVSSTCGSFVGNFGNARIHGIEAETRFEILPGWTLSANGSFTDAKFRSFNPGYAGSFNVKVDQRLVNTPKFQGSIGSEYDIDLGDEKGIRVRADVQYTGSTPTNYAYTNDSYTLPSTTNVNVALAGHIGKTEVELFVRNLTDSYQPLGANPARSRNFAQYFVAPPRTIGITLRHSY
jgi:outer membrane receptor protein involved in Fe transport